MTSLELERRYLLVSVVGNVVVGCVGFAVAMISASQAILLDALFNLSYFATGLFTVKVASLVAGGDDERFPHGYAFFEPLVNGIKGILVLGVSAAALIGGVQALLSGGREVAAGAAIAYGVFASATCGITAWIMHEGGKKTNSPLVRADAQNWGVNAAISFCVLIAFAGILLLRALGLDGMVPYVDPVVVIAVVSISLSVPVRMAYNALMALLNRAPSSEIISEVTKIIDENLQSLPVRERFIRVIQPGRVRMVLVHIVLPTDHEIHSLRELDEIRERSSDALQEAHLATVSDILFTYDRKWGAPVCEQTDATSESSSGDDDSPAP